jgi:hypothetical protein
MEVLTQPLIGQDVDGRQPGAPQVKRNPVRLLVIQRAPDALA